MLFCLLLTSNSGESDCCYSDVPLMKSFSPFVEPMPYTCVSVCK